MINFAQNPPKKRKRRNSSPDGATIRLEQEFNGFIGVGEDDAQTFSRARKRLKVCDSSSEEIISDTGSLGFLEDLDELEERPPIQKPRKRTSMLDKPSLFTQEMFSALPDVAESERNIVEPRFPPPPECQISKPIPPRVEEPAEEVDISKPIPPPPREPEAKPLNVELFNVNRKIVGGATKASFCFSLIQNEQDSLQHIMDLTTQFIDNLPSTVSAKEIFVFSGSHESEVHTLDIQTRMPKILDPWTDELHAHILVRLKTSCNISSVDFRRIFNNTFKNCTVTEICSVPNKTAYVGWLQDHHVEYITRPDGLVREKKKPIVPYKHGGKGRASDSKNKDKESAFINWLWHSGEIDLNAPLNVILGIIRAPGHRWCGWFSIGLSGKISIVQYYRCLYAASRLKNLDFVPPLTYHGMSRAKEILARHQKKQIKRPIEKPTKKDGGAMICGPTSIGKSSVFAECLRRRVAVYTFSFKEKYDRKCFFQPDAGIIDIDGHEPFPRSITWLQDAMDMNKPVTLVIKKEGQQVWKPFPIYFLYNGTLEEAFPRASQKELDVLLKRMHYVRVESMDDVDLYNITSSATGPNDLALEEELKLRDDYEQDSSGIEDF